MFNGIKKHHVLFGLGALAAGYYFYKKKLEAAEAQDAEEPEETEEDTENEET